MAHEKKEAQHGCACAQEKHAHDCCCEHEEHEHGCGCEHEKHEHDCCSEHEEHEHTCGCGCGCGEHAHGEGEEKTMLYCLAGAALLFCGGLCASFLGAPAAVSIGIFLLAYLLAGFDVLKEAVSGIRHGEIFGEEFLMCVASIGAFLIGEYAEACAVMLLFTLGEFLQGRAVAKSRASIREMLELRPERVTVLRDGAQEVCAPEDVRVGDVLLILPGEKFACDGVLVEGAGDVDTAALTGESLPVPKAVGDEILAGSISVDATFRMRVTESYDKSTVSKILELLEHAKEKKSPTESFIRRFARIYTPAVCGFALLVAILPPLFGFGTFSEWVYRALCALAASCPCALVISVPLTLFGGLGAASRAGVLIKGGNDLETLAGVTGAAFDKTGTVTAGRFSPVGSEHAPDEARLRRAILVCETYSTHPIAEAARAAFPDAADGVTVTDAAAIPGKGVRATADGVVYLCGNAALMEENGVAYTPATLVGTTVYAAEDGKFLGSMTFADTVKPDSAAALSALSALGIRDTVMLTGDKRPIAEAVAQKAGIRDCRAELLPDGKVREMEALRANGGSYVYVGDGINDAPVLATADVGVAMGGIGSAAAIEAADVVIMGDSLTKLPEAIGIARKTMRIARENIVFSLAVKLLIVVLASLGYANLWLAVFGDVGVCLLAVLNALRVMQKPKKA